MPKALLSILVFSLCCSSALAQSVNLQAIGSAQTTEGGGTATIRLTLDSDPTPASVSIPLMVDDASEGVVLPTSVILDGTNWDTGVDVSVTGQNDPDDDGDILYGLLAGPTMSTDTGFDNLGPFFIGLQNIDDDTAGILVSPTFGLTTDEKQTLSPSFTVVLQTPPASEVIINLASSDTTEGIAGTTTLTFDAGNWSMPQAVNVDGRDDPEIDGDVPYTIVLDAASSVDTNYDGINPVDVSLINLDDDNPGEFRFSAANYTGGEEGVLSVVVERINGDAGSVSCRVSTQSGSAFENLDFIDVDRTLSFADGDSAAQTVELVAISDRHIENDETLMWSLDEPTGGATFNAAQSTAIFTLHDAPGELSFEYFYYSASEGVANAQVRVCRRAGQDGEVTTQVQLESLTAGVPGDVNIPSPDVIFADGETGCRNVVLAVADDGDDEGDEVVLLSLSAPSAGADFGDASLALMILSDNDAPSASRVFWSKPDGIIDEGDSQNLLLLRAGDTSGVETLTLQSSNPRLSVVSQVQFAAQQSEILVNVDLVDDGIAQVLDDATISIVTSSSALLGAQSSVSLRLVDNDGGVGGTRFCRTQSRALERAGAKTVSICRDGSLAEVLSIDVADLEATEGLDYAERGDESFAVFAAGEHRAEVWLSILDDVGLPVVENDERLSLSFSGQDHILTIVDVENTAGGALEFVESEISVDETAGRISISLDRVGGVSGVLMGSVTLSSGTAIAGDDVVLATSSLVLDPFVSTAVVVLDIVDDSLIEGEESLQIQVQTGVSGPISSATLTIFDDERPGEFRFQEDTYWVREDAGQLDIVVERIGGRDGSADLLVAVIEGDASSALDLVAFDPVLTFDDQQVEATLTLNILDDELEEGAESLTLELQSPSGLSQVAEPSQSIVNIEDVEPPSIEFVETEYQVYEIDGDVGLRLRRNNDVLPVVNVRVETLDAAARAGSDYTQISEIVTFLSGEDEATVFVPILGDLNTESGEAFEVFLSDASDNARVGLDSRALVTIFDSSDEQFFTGGGGVGCVQSFGSSWLSMLFVLIFGCVRRRRR